LKNSSGYQINYFTGTLAGGLKLDAFLNSSFVTQRVNSSCFVRTAVIEIMVIMLLCKREVSGNVWCKCRPA